MEDTNNPLEELIVQMALKSEMEKLNYRKVVIPETINILDYTIIAALEKQISKKPLIVNESEVVCPTCRYQFFYSVPIRAKVKDRYCKNCGQKLDWD